MGESLKLHVHNQTHLLWGGIHAGINNFSGTMQCKFIQNSLMVCILKDTGTGCNVDGNKGKEEEDEEELRKEEEEMVCSSTCSSTDFAVLYKLHIMQSLVAVALLLIYMYSCT